MFLCFLYRVSVCRGGWHPRFSVCFWFFPFPHIFGLFRDYCRPLLPELRPHLFGRRKERGGVALWVRGRGRGGREMSRENESLAEQTSTDLHLESKDPVRVGAVEGFDLKVRCRSFWFLLPSQAPSFRSKAEAKQILCNVDRNTVRATPLPKEIWKDG